LTSLFDASAILYFIERNEPELMAGRYTSDLALYELGNAIWKESVLLKRLNAEERNRVLGMVSRVLGLMKVLRAEGQERRIMDVAAQLRITYYDATYVHMARAVGARLVTVDRKLARRAKPLVEVVDPVGVSSPAI
jgi:predicted nucleic acid-binding protein